MDNETEAEMGKTTFGNWPPEIHTEPEQVQRIIASLDDKLVKGIQGINKEVPTLLIKGSGKNPYETTFGECTCVDFAKRRLPCKHMYLLAFAMGEFDGLPRYDETAGFSPEAELERYKAAYINGQIPAKAYVEIGKALLKL